MVRGREPGGDGRWGGWVVGCVCVSEVVKGGGVGSRGWGGGVDREDPGVAPPARLPSHPRPSFCKDNKDNCQAGNSLVCEEVT